MPNGSGNGGRGGGGERGGSYCADEIGKGGDGGSGGSGGPEVATAGGRFHP